MRRALLPERSTAASYVANRCVPPRRVAPRDLFLYGCRDAFHDAEGRFGRHRPEGPSRRLLSAGKTGTGQKIDPATGAYSKTKYNATFAGFAPLNNPQIVVAVILDSPVGLHQGGQVSAPVFRRISQQVLEYLHVPHDLPLAPKHQLLLAQSKVKDKDLADDTPDHPGEPLETAEVNGNSSEARSRRLWSGCPPPRTPQRMDGRASGSAGTSFRCSGRWNESETFCGTSHMLNSRKSCR